MRGLVQRFDAVVFNEGLWYNLMGAGGEKRYEIKMVRVHGGAPVIAFSFFF